MAEADTIKSEIFNINVNIKPGNQYKWVKLETGNLNQDIVSRSGYNEKLYTNSVFNQKQLTDFFENIIINYENNGYPFASVKLDSVHIINDSIHAVIKIDKNKFYKLDSINIVGTAKINQKFIYRYLGIYPNKPYNEQAIKTIGKKIIQLPFVIQKQPQVVRLSDKANKLYLFLDKKNASQFDGIIGILPNSLTGKTILTGDIKIKLVNGLFRNGETFDLEWRRLQQLTQDFKGRVIYPYIFGSAFGADYSLKIYKKDTSFIDINNDFGVNYYFSGLNHIKAFIKQRSSNLISTAGLENITTLPSYADVSTQLNGFGVSFEKLDYRFNPKKGFSIIANASAGIKKIKKNPKVNEIAYSALNLSSAQYLYDAVINAFINIKGNHVLKFGIQSASIFGNSPVFRNELFRIGGLKTLRGFDEESIYASTYVIPTIEYRFLFAQNSNLVIFTEGAFYENNGYGTYLKDTPISFGTGINFETKAGILSINYAIGSQFNTGFDARSGKIHFGLTTLF